MSSNIRGAVSPVLILKERNGGLELTGGSSGSSLDQQAMQQFRDTLTNDIAVQLRSGKVAFVPPPSLNAEGYMNEPSEEEKNAASLDYMMEVHRIKNVYCYSIRMTLTQKAYMLPSSTRPVYVTTWSCSPYDSYTTSEAKVIPGLREATRHAVDSFIKTYSQTNGIPAPTLLDMADTGVSSSAPFGTPKK